MSEKIFKNEEKGIVVAVEDDPLAYLEKMADIDKIPYVLIARIFIHNPSFSDKIVERSVLNLQDGDVWNEKYGVRLAMKRLYKSKKVLFKNFLKALSKEVDSLNDTIVHLQVKTKKSIEGAKKDLNDLLNEQHIK